MELSEEEKETIGFSTISREKMIENRNTPLELKFSGVERK